MQEQKIGNSDENKKEDQLLDSDVKSEDVSVNDIKTFDESEEVHQNDAVNSSEIVDESEEPEDNGKLTYDELLLEHNNLKDRLMRSLADHENLRKRAERDRKDAELYGGTKLARDLLSVFDNMSRALDNIDDDLRKMASALVEGIELTQRELVSVFSKHKIDQIRPSEGEKFDPKYHQAMFEAPAPGTKKGTIIQVMTNGFKIGDRLLRASQVGVSSNLDGASGNSEKNIDEEDSKAEIKSGD